MTRYLAPCVAALLLISGCSGSNGAAGPTGPTGPAGAPCAVADNGNGTKTITCPGSAPVTVADGAQGGSCTVTGGGTPVKTITCEDGTSVTVSDGAPCVAVDNGDGTKTLTCPGGAPVVLTDGTRCSVVDNQDGTSILSCSDGTRTVLASPLATALQPWEPLPGAVVTVAAVGGGTNADGTFAAGDRLGVTFTVRTAAGRLIPLRDLDQVGAWFAGPTSGYQHLLPAARDAVMYVELKTAATLNDDGSFTYLFPDAIPGDYGVPLFDTTKFSDGEASGPLAPGTYTVGLAVWKGYTVAGSPVTDAASATRDLLLGHAPVLEPREVVTDVNCEACHGSLRAHGGAFRSVATCVTCHTAGAEDADSTDSGDATPITIEASVMLHKVHNGAHLPSVQGITTADDGSRVYGTGAPYVVGTRDFSSVRFPVFPSFNVAMPKGAGYSALASANKTKNNNVRTGVTACGACHLDPDVTMANPTRRACGACHDDLDFAKPYVANGSTMPANSTDANCALCHPVPALQADHRHPLADPAVAPQFSVTGLSAGGGSGPGGNFLPGDFLSLTFQIKDVFGADLPLTSLDSFTAGVVGPTTNRQVVFAGQPGSPVDFAGRLAAASTTNKGTMSKVQPGGTLVSETLTVDFTSATAFTVSGSVSGDLGSSALPGSPSTNPSGSSLSNVVLSAAAVPQAITVAFTSATSYTVTGSVSGPLGTGALPASTSNTQRFTSIDQTVSFNVVLGTTAAAAGNTFNLVVVKGPAANPVLFAIVGGRAAFAATDRFYYDLVAPSVSYTLALPMDLQFEHLGDADGTAGQVLTAANLPVRLGRQTLYERTATPGLLTSLTAPSPVLGRYLTLSAVDPGLAANDFVVVEDGTANEEYARVASVDAANRRLTLSSPLRFAHSAFTAVQEVTMTYRQEGSGNYYTLSPATGQVTLSAAAITGNAFVMTYRTDARFGWKRKAGDTLQAIYYAPLSEAPGLDETEGDWRGKPLVDGTYTAAAWGYRSAEFRSGGAGAAAEWQTYRNTTGAATLDLLYGATATTITPYAKVDDLEGRCNACHGDLSFHGGGRRGPDTCLICHATPGPGVGYRVLLHGLHQAGLPVMPNGSASCASCHGTADVTVPADRSHPTAPLRPALDWTVACGGCHTATAAQAHFETMTAASSGYEACATCHGPGRELPVAQVHQAR